MLLLHAYLGVAPLSGRVVRAEKQLASYYDDNYSSRITVGRRAQLGDEMVYGNSTGLIYEVTRSARSG